MQVQVIVTSARSLKNVNWRSGALTPYAVVWIDTSRKCSTKVDTCNGMNPVWDEKFTIPLPPTSLPNSAVLCIDIVHANAPAGTKPLVGSVRFPLSATINDARVHGYASLCLNLTRPSGRPQGTIEVRIGVKDPNFGQVNVNNQYNVNPQQIPYGQHVQAQVPQNLHQANNVPPQNHFQIQHQGSPYQPQPQPQVVQPQVGPYQPRPQVVQPQVSPYQPRPQVSPYQPQVVQPQAQFQPRPQVVQPRPQIQPQGQYVQPQPMVKPQPQVHNNQNKPQVVQAQVQPQPRPNLKIQQQQKPEAQVQVQVQPMKKPPNKPAQPQPQPQPNNNAKLQQQQKQQAAVQQPMRKQPNNNNKQAPAQAQNYKGPVRQTPAQQAPRNNVPPAPGTNRPRNRPGNNPGAAQQPYFNPARDMMFVQNQARQLLFNNNGNNGGNNNNNNAGQGGAGANDNAETKSVAADANVNANGELKSSMAVEAEVNNNGEMVSAADNGGGNAVDAANLETAEEMHSVEAFNDAESIHLSYEEAQNEAPNASVERDIGEYNYGEYAAGTEEYDTNAGTECEYGANYDTNGGTECEYGTNYDTNAGTECEYGVYDSNPGTECEYGAYGAYDPNAGTESEYGIYDVNGGDQECGYGGYEDGNEYVDEQYDGAFDGAGLDSQIESGEVEVACEY